MLRPFFAASPLLPELVVPGFGLVKRCVDCRASAAPGAPGCGGFGPGCLVSPGRGSAPKTPAG